MDRFPTPRAIADVSEAEVLVAWAGLGYNRRALALRRTALAVQERGCPADVEGLQRLPGIGPYTARAVAALAFGRPVGAVDTNVRRWLSRRFGLRAPTQPVLQELADGLATCDPSVTSDTAAAWMHASMEFGANVCRPRAPDCPSCPIAAGCPSRDLAVHVPVARQAPFAGSDRALRGALLRQLTSHPQRRLSMAAARRLAGTRLQPLLDGLEKDRLAHRAGRFVRLGGRGAAEATTTIRA